MRGGKWVFCNRELRGGGIVIPCGVGGISGMWGEGGLVGVCLFMSGV